MIWALNHKNLRGRLKSERLKEERKVWEGFSLPLLALKMQERCYERRYCLEFGDRFWLTASKEVGSQSSNCRWLNSANKERDPPLEPKKETQSRWHLDFSPMRPMSDLWPTQLYVANPVSPFLGGHLLEVYCVSLVESRFPDSSWSFSLA